MRKPSYEKQNSWLNRYVVPILTGSPETAFSNYFGYKNDNASRDALRYDMEQAGVFDSLERMEKQGTAYEREVIGGIKRQAEAERIALEDFFAVFKDFSLGLGTRAPVGEDIHIINKQRLTIPPGLVERLRSRLQAQ